MWSQHGQLTIGSFCSIAEGVTCFLSGNHAMEWISAYPFWLKGFNKPIPQEGRWNSKRNFDIIIGNDVWIGGGVTIMGGVRIGDGAVIGRNSHVMSNVKPYSVVGGNPAQRYFYRFDKDTIAKLLELKWWDLSDDIINELTPYLCSNNVNKLIEECQKHKK
jgi:acetyltransferase-like isoleucine patch superfamily enzyme